MSFRFQEIVAFQCTVLLLRLGTALKDDGLLENGLFAQCFLPAAARSSLPKGNGCCSWPAGQQCAVSVAAGLLSGQLSSGCTLSLAGHRVQRCCVQCPVLLPIYTEQQQQKQQQHTRLRQCAYG